MQKKKITVLKLIIDIGNTQTKTALYKKGELVYINKTVKTPKYIVEKALEKGVVSSCIISTVKNDDKTLQNLLEKNDIKTLMLRADTPVPFTNLYKTPETLGKDRLALAARAVRLFPNKNTLIIDAGTSITYDYINNQNEYLGGGISPGLQMRFKALHTFTDKLPLISVENNISPILIGETTREAILSGVINGIIAEIDGIIDAYKQKFSDLNIVLSGGDYKYFDKRLKNSIFARSNFVLEGLLEILNFNEEK